MPITPLVDSSLAITRELACLLLKLLLGLLTPRDTTQIDATHASQDLPFSFGKRFGQAIQLCDLLISIILLSLCFRLVDVTRADLVVRKAALEHELRVSLLSRMDDSLVKPLVSFLLQSNSTSTIP